MVRKDINICLDEHKLEEFKIFCKNTGRVISRTIEIAMEEYIETHKNFK